MNKLSVVVASVVSLASLIGGNAYALDGLSANASISNNYIWRGLSQTQNQVGVSGGIDFDTSAGFYIGTWASNVDFSDQTTAEIDVYGGYRFEINELAVDVGYLYYGYPGGDDLAFSEVYASVTWQVVTIGYNILAESQWGDDFGDSDYAFADIAFEISDGLELGLHYGHSSFDGAQGYSDYGVSLSKNGFSFGLTDTDSDAIESDFLVSVSYSIDFDL